MRELKFSTNWNKKLCCNVFTTLRLNDQMQIGDLVLVKIKDKNRGIVEILDKKMIYLSELTDDICYLDTGYNAEETKKILQTMYKNKNVNWKLKPLYLYFLKYNIPEILPCVEQAGALKELKNL